MKKKSLRYFVFELKISAVILFVIVLNGRIQAQSVFTNTFNFTGSVQTFTVPPCVTSVTFDVRGAAGGDISGTTLGYSQGTVSLSGGSGGRAVATLTVIPGEVLTIYVGGKPIGITGGYNGGGSAAGCAGTEVLAAGGGGASDVRRGGTLLSNRIIVAGGGGGSAGSASTFYQAANFSGSGGGINGANALNNSLAGSCTPGQGGTQTAGGAGGYNLCWCNLNGAAGSGSLGLGGNSICAPSGLSTCFEGTLGITSGGGGGGGYYGGGAGIAYAGGGGGSGWIEPTATGTTQVAGFQLGHGAVYLTYCPLGNGVSVSQHSIEMCTGSSVVLTAGSVNTYTWLSTGTFPGSNLPTVTVTPTSNTSYTLLGTNSLGCVSQLIIPAIVSPGSPQLNILNTSGSNGICINQTVALTASGASTYTWTGNFPVVNGIPFSPSATSGYTVTGTNACGTGSASTSVIVNPLPTLTTSASQLTICSGQPVVFLVTGNAATYNWSGGITNGVAFTPMISTTLTATAISVQGCTASAVASVSVITTPATPPVITPTSVCNGNTATLVASGAGNYTWSTSSGSFFSNSITVTPSLTTTYTLTRSNLNCVSTQTLQLFVQSLPVLQAFASPPVICAGKSSILQAGGGQTFTWTAIGNPTLILAGATQTVAPVNTTTFVLAGSDGTCVNTSTLLVQANPNPPVSIAANTNSICAGGTVSLTAAGANSYTWSTNTGTFSGSATGTLAGSSLVDQPLTITVYSVTGTNSFNCTSGTSLFVFLNPLPNLNVQAIKPLVCPGGSASLTVSGANSYTWHLNAGNKTGSVTTVSPLSATIYTVMGTFTNSGCSSTGTVQVSIMISSLTASGPASVCPGSIASLSASGANSYTWIGIQSAAQVTVAPVTNTFYVVSAITQSSGVGCNFFDTVFVSLYPHPDIIASQSKSSICKGESVIIRGSGGVTYKWSNGMSGDSILVKPNVTTSYSVTAVDLNGCSSSLTVQVAVSPCSALPENATLRAELSIYPNPNNGTFIISCHRDLSLEVINSIGRLIRSIQVYGGESQKVDLGHLPSGTYIISGVVDGDPFVQKMIISD